MIRILDMFFSMIGLTLGSPLLLLIFVIGLFDTGLPLFYQQRVGRLGKQFRLVKFRSMVPSTTSAVATHLADTSTITKFGHFLRRTKLDELPQLWNVLKGNMSLVGPRPCLTTQQVLIRERFKRGVFNIRPGITGLAQINGIDMSTPKKLAITDAEMLATLTVKNYFSYIVQTLIGKGSGDKVKPET